MTRNTKLSRQRERERERRTMEKLPSKHTTGRPQDYDGLLSNLQEWEMSFEKENKKIKPDSAATGKMAHRNKARSSESLGANEKNASPFTSTTGSIRNYDNLNDYEALSRLTTGGKSQETFLDANAEKELGNDFFKQKKFNEAVDCYSRSIALSPTAVAYANRAMAYIKIRRFQEAENDCTEALNLDDRYIKAYSRRSTARKELGKLKEAMEDAEFALRLEPHNQEIKKQYGDCKSLFEKEILKKASTDKSKPDKAKAKEGSAGRVAEIPENNLLGNREVASSPVVEVQANNARVNASHNGDLGTSNAKPYIDKQHKQELRASVQELAANAANLAKAKATENIVMPTSAYQFEVSWRGLSGDQSLQARLLKATPPTALPGLFKNALSAPILVDMIREDTALCVEYLQNLTKIPRFDMIIMCLSSADKSDILKIWNEVFSKGGPDFAQIIGDLKPKYCS